MTENFPAQPGVPSSATADQVDEPTAMHVIKDQAATTGHTALDAGQEVASSVVEQAQHVAAEAGHQAKDLLQQARGEIADNAGVQQQRLVDGIRALGDELKSMSQQSPQHGVASDLAQQAGAKSHEIASWLSAREPAHLVEELQYFARKRPGAFLAVALGTGLMAGRLTRGVKDASTGTSSKNGSSATASTTRQDSITLPAAAPYAGMATAGATSASTTPVADQYPLGALDTSSVSEGR